MKVNISLEEDDINKIEKMIVRAIREGIREGEMLPVEIPEEKPIILHSNKELAEALHLSMPKLLQMKKEGLIPYIKIGRKSEFDLNHVKRALRKNYPKKF